MKICFLRLATSFLVVLTGACDRNGDVGGIYSQAVTSEQQLGDTIIVRTVRGSAWRDTMLLVAQVEIGVLDGDPEYIFGAVRAIDVAPDGRIAVVDAQATNLRVFSSEGSHLMTIGRNGEGPGEFRQPDHVRITADGRFVVRDQPMRFSVFSSRGEHLGGWPLRSGYATSEPFYLESGLRVVNPNRPDTLLRYELDGTVMDTIAAPTRGFEPPRLEVTMPGGGHATYSVPFSPQERWTMTRTGEVLFGRTDSYRIERWNDDGTVLRIEREVDPVTVAPGEHDQARERIERQIQRANNPSWRWNGPDIPSTKPAWRALITGVDGSIWVIRSTQAAEEPDPAWDLQNPDAGFQTRWVESVVADVFREDGQYLGPVKIPSNVRLFPYPVVSTDMVLASTIHDQGHPQVVRFRLERMSEGSQRN